MVCVDQGWSELIKFYRQRKHVLGAKRRAGIHQAYIGGIKISSKLYIA